MSEAKFQIGDTVYHKASGERGVVVDMAMRCTVHPPMHSAHLFGGSRGECEFVFAGTYDLSVGLGRVMEGIDEDVLELGSKIGESNPESESDKPPMDLYEKCVYAGETGVPEVFVAGHWHPLADYSVSNLHDQNEDVGTGSCGDISTGPSGWCAGDAVSRDMAVCTKAALRDGKDRVTHGFVRAYFKKGKSNE